MDDGTKVMTNDSHLKPVFRSSSTTAKQHAINTIISNTKIPYFQIAEIKVVGVKDSCPVCKNEYQTIDHPIHGAKIQWSDCLTCKKTKEQLEAEEKEWKGDKDEVDKNYGDFGFYN